MRCRAVPYHQVGATIVRAYLVIGVVVVGVRVKIRVRSGTANPNSCRQQQVTTNLPIVLTVALTFSSGTPILLTTVYRYDIPVRVCLYTCMCIAVPATYHAPCTTYHALMGSFPQLGIAIVRIRGAQGETFVFLPGTWYLVCLLRVTGVHTEQDHTSPHGLSTFYEDNLTSTEINRLFFRAVCSVHPCTMIESSWGTTHASSARRLYTRRNGHYANCE